MTALVVVEKDQPFGEQGTRFSLEEVARRVVIGGKDARVRGWAMECLERARVEQGIPCDTDRQRATVLLKAVQKKLWVPDPVGVEFMAGAHLMACDRSTRETLCIGTGDCDDKVILAGSVFLSVGIYVVVVGHAYGAARSISHVLYAVWLDGQWEYADPSTDLPLGTCVKFTRERLLSVPNVKAICDANVCLTDKKAYHPEQNDFVIKGVFIGVDGPPVHSPVFAWTVPASAVGDVGQTAEQQAQAAGEKAAAKKIDEGGGITNQDAADVAGVTAGVAAAVLCSEGGPIASAACGTVAAAVTEFLTKALLDGLADIGNSGALPIQPRGYAAAKLAMLHNRLLPNEKPWTYPDAMPLLYQASKSTPYELSEAGVRTKFAGKYGPVQPWPPIVSGTSEQERLFASYVRPAENNASARLVAKAAVQQATNSGSQKKSSSFLPLALIGAAAGGIWWLSKR